MKARGPVSAAFALGELIVVLMLAGIVTAALLAGLIALVNGLHPRALVVSGQPVPLAPTFAAFPAAVRLHEALTREFMQARAVYVFGGIHPSLPGTERAATVGPLAAQTLPSISDFSAGLPLATVEFYDRFSGELGSLATAPARDAYSVLVVGERAGTLAVTCLVQVARVDLPADEAGGPYVLRDVKLWTSGETQGYVFAERAAGGGAFVGAVHTWLRHDSATGIFEEGPACVVFPDPWLYAAASGTSPLDAAPPFSRFSYFVPVSS